MGALFVVGLEAQCTFLDRSMSDHVLSEKGQYSPKFGTLQPHIATVDNAAPNSGLYSHTYTVDKTAPTVYAVKAASSCAKGSRALLQQQWESLNKRKGRGNAFGSKQRCREARGAVKVGKCPGEERKRCAQKPSVPNILVWCASEPEFPRFGHP